MTPDFYRLSYLDDGDVYAELYNDEGILHYKCINYCGESYFTIPFLDLCVDSNYSDLKKYMDEDTDQNIDELCLLILRPIYKRFKIKKYPDTPPRLTRQQENATISDRLRFLGCSANIAQSDNCLFWFKQLWDYFGIIIEN